jgi:hypothetical protein
MFRVEIKKCRSIRSGHRVRAWLRKSTRFHLDEEPCHILPVELTPQRRALFAAA